MKSGWIVPVLALLAMTGVARADCGDGALDPGEECDDANLTDGDCCSSACLFEAVGSACPDDVNICTDDVCDATGQCTHPDNTAPCDDGIFCNGDDTCDAGTCTHAGDPCAGGSECADSCNEAAGNCFAGASTPCTSDGNVCTDDHCNGAGGCTHANNAAPCTDGLFCNGADTCGGGSCSAHTGNPCTGGPTCARTCNEAADNCYDSAATTCADDGNTCTDDHCNGSGSCIHPNNTVPCNDGLFCNGADTCSGGACGVHAGNPCTGGPACAHTCNEVADNCFDSAATTCADDGNVCTTDRCNGAGSCIHPNNTAPCNDGLFCNGADTCGGGTCSTHAGNPCVSGPACARTCNESVDNCFDPTSTPCADDGLVCTLDTCNGAGACAHPPTPNGTVCRASTSPCDAAETCNGVAPTCPADGLLPDDAPCDDGNPCTGDDTCRGGVCSGGPPVVCSLCERCDNGSGCMVGPRPSCKQAIGTGKTSLSLKNKVPNTLDAVRWKWTAGQATTLTELGAPLTTDDYALCIYTGAAANLTFKGTAPAGGWCGNVPCWRGTTNVVKYSDKKRTPDGTYKVYLKPGADGHARVSFDGKGDDLSDRPLGIPAPPLALPVQVQLQSQGGSCFESTYSAPTKNGSGYFQAR